jgi:hypothetical protein
VTISDQVDALQKRAEDLKSSFDQSRHETNEQVKARLGQARADIAGRQDAVKEQAKKTAGRAQSQWQAMKADAAAKLQAIQDRIDRQRDEHDVTMADKDAEAAEDEASDALDYATWAVDQAQLAVLDAVAARNWANAQAAASPSRS